MFIKDLLKPREKILVIVLILAALAALATGGWRLGGASLYAELRSLRAEHGALRQEIAALKAARDLGNQAGSEYESLLPEILILKERVPPPDALPGVLESLEEAVALPEGSMESFKVGEATCADDFCSVEVKLTATCHPANLDGLLRRLESFPHLLAPLQLRWVNGENGQTTLELSFLLIFTGPLDPSGPAEDQPGAFSAAGGETGE